MYSPFEEFHQQADVEYASEDEEHAVPQTDAGVEGVEVEVVVVADASDDCRARRSEKTHTHTHKLYEYLTALNLIYKIFTTSYM